MATGSYQRKSFTGGAQPTALSAPITGTPSSFNVLSSGGSTYPDGADGPFVVVLGRNTATEEKILISTRIGDQFNIETRGYDNTTSTDHDVGEVVEHVLDASTIDQVNRYANLQTSKGDLVVHDGNNSIRLPVGADDSVLVADSTAVEGMSYKTLENLVGGSFASVIAHSQLVTSVVRGNTAGTAFTLTSTYYDGTPLHEVLIPNTLYSLHFNGVFTANTNCTIVISSGGVPQLTLDWPTLYSQSSEDYDSHWEYFSLPAYSDPVEITMTFYAAVVGQTTRLRGDDDSMRSTLTLSRV